MHEELKYWSVNNLYRYLLVTNLLNLLKYETSPFTFKQLDLEDKVYRTRNRFLNSKIVPKKESVKNSWIYRSTEVWNALQCFKFSFIDPEQYKMELKGEILKKFPNILHDKIIWIYFAGPVLMSSKLQGGHQKKESF